MKHIVLISLAAAVFVGCQDGTLPTDTGLETPNFAINDGSTGGNEEVFFLPPLVEDPTDATFGDSDANPNLGPVARICLLDGAACDDGGPAFPDLPMVFSDLGQHYRVNWRTRRFGGSGLVSGEVYRIQIFIQDVLLASRDVRPLSNMKGTDESCDVGVVAVCLFRNGANLPIKVRIEEFALCPVLKNCVTKTFALNMPTKFVLDNAEFDVPAQGLAGNTTVTLQPCEVDDISGRIDLPTFGPCLETVTDFSGELNVAATVSICVPVEILAADLADVGQVELLTMYHFGNDGTVDALPDNNSCDTPPDPRFILSRSLTTNPLFRLARAIGDRVAGFLGTRPLEAATMRRINRGGGGDTFEMESKFKLVLPGEAVLSDPADLTPRDALLGSSLPVEVKVQDVNGDPILGAKVTFDVAGSTTSGATLTPGPSPTTITTIGTGIAAVSWTLPSAGVYEVTAGGKGIGVPGDGGPFVPDPGVVEVPLDREITFTAEAFEFVIEASPVTGVVPLEGALPIADFYSYASTCAASANTGLALGTVIPGQTGDPCAFLLAEGKGLETLNTSILFLYKHATTGDVSLVMIHDRPRDGSGGRAEFLFTGVATGTEFTVEDDNGDLPLVVPTSPTKAIWNWINCCTDGGAFSVADEDFTITIDAAFPARTAPGSGQIATWTWLTGTLASRIPIDLPLSGATKVGSVIIRRKFINP